MLLSPGNFLKNLHSKQEEIEAGVKKMVARSKLQGSLKMEPQVNVDEAKQPRNEGDDDDFWYSNPRDSTQSNINLEQYKQGNVKKKWGA